MSRHRKNDRPDIWAEGRQHPPFEARAFARATLGFARESLGDLLDRCALSARDGGMAVAAGWGRIPEARLGRTGRYLPSHRALGGLVLGLGRLLGETARKVRATPADTPPSLFRPVTPPVSPAEPAPVPPMPRPRRLTPSAAPAPLAEAEATGQDADLAAIRALLTAPLPAPLPEPVAPPLPRAASAPAPAYASAPPPAATPPEDEVNWRRAWLRGALARALGFGLLVVSVPYGAVRATLAHLNGEDLRKLS